MPIIGRTPMTVAFTDGSSPADEITYWLWDFGDGTTYEGQTPPAHPYDTDGIYTVTLSVASAKGIDTFSDTVTALVVSPPVAYLKMDEVNGTRVATAGPDLLETGGAVASAAGKFGLAALGVSEASTAGLYAPITLAASGGFTLAIWFYWPAWSSNDAKSMLALDCGTGSGALVSPFCAVTRFYGSDFLHVLFAWGGGGSENVELPLPRLGPFDEDAWHLLVLTYDVATGLFTGAVDQGCLEDAVDWTGVPLPAYKLSVTVAPAELANANAATFTDLRMILAWTTDVSFEGRIDALRIWDSALSAAEISWIWNGGAGN